MREQRLGRTDESLKGRGDGGGVMEVGQREEG